MVVCVSVWSSDGGDERSVGEIICICVSYVCACVCVFVMRVATSPILISASSVRRVGLTRGELEVHAMVWGW